MEEQQHLGLEGEEAQVTAENLDYRYSWKSLSRVRIIIHLPR